MNQDAEIKDRLENLRKELDIFDKFIEKLNINKSASNGRHINDLLNHTSSILNIYKQICILYMEYAILEYEKESKPVSRDKKIVENIAIVETISNKTKQEIIELEDNIEKIQLKLKNELNEDVLQELKREEKELTDRKEILSRIADSDNAIWMGYKKIEEVLNHQDSFRKSNGNFLFHVRISTLEFSLYGVHQKFRDINSKRQAISPIIASNLTNIIGASNPLVGWVKVIFDLLNDINKINGNSFIRDELNIIRFIEDLYIFCYSLSENILYLIAVIENFDENENKDKWLNLLLSFNNEIPYYEMLSSLD